MLKDVMDRMDHAFLEAQYEAYHRNTEEYLARSCDLLQSNRQFIIFQFHRVNAMSSHSALLGGEFALALILNAREKRDDFPIERMMAQTTASEVEREAIGFVSDQAAFIEQFFQIVDKDKCKIIPFSGIIQNCFGHEFMTGMLATFELMRRVEEIVLWFKAPVHGSGSVN